MSCKRMEEDGMRYMDGEMSDEEKDRFLKHIEGCEECRNQIARFSELKRLTERVTIKDPIDIFWDGYWKSIYRRIERKTGWILFVLGAVLIAAYEIYRSVRNLGEFSFIKTAGLVIILGVLLLLVSVIRERIHQRKSDRYRDVIR